MTDLRQALRNAIEVERSAARFYQTLAPRAKDPRARSFLERMATEETAHAAGFEEKSRELAEGRLPDWPDMQLEQVETVPDWGCAEDISYAQALQVALEAEQHAELFYDAIADMATSPSVQAFFRQVASNEAAHSKTIAALIEAHAAR